MSCILMENHQTLFLYGNYFKGKSDMCINIFELKDPFYLFNYSNTSYKKGMSGQTRNKSNSSSHIANPPRPPQAVGYPGPTISGPSGPNNRRWPKNNK